MPSARTPVTIRSARPADARALAVLAALDSTSMPQGEVLVADVNGKLVAAFGIDNGERIGDPFERTAEILDLLALRAALLRGEGSRRPLVARWVRRRAVRARAV